MAIDDPTRATQEALQAALEAENKTQFAFNRGGTPKVLRSPLARTMFMFQSYTLHQINFSAELIKDALITGLPGAKGRLAMHLGAYIAVISPLMMMGYDASQRYAHPILDMHKRVTEEPPARGFGGPWAATGLNMVSFVLGRTDLGDALEKSFMPAQAARTMKAFQQQEGLDIPLRIVTGLRPEKRKRTKRTKQRTKARTR